MRWIFNRIISGDSLSIIGVGSVGKTHLIRRFSTGTDVQNHYLKELGAQSLNATDIVYLRVDPNAMLDSGAPGDVPDGWPGYELLISRLLIALQEEDNPDLMEDLQKKYRSACKTDGLGPLIAFRHFESAVRKVLGPLGGKQRLVIIFDEAEELFARMPYSFFRNMRALRDEFRYRLLFITASRLEIPSLVRLGDEDALEPFTELFPHPLYLGPFNTTEDRQEVINEFLARRGGGRDLLQPQHDFLMYATGGHGGLFRTCLNWVYSLDVQQGQDEHLLTRLVKDPSVSNECAIMLRSCSIQERDLLLSVARMNKKEEVATVDSFPGRFYYLQTLYNKMLIKVNSQGHLVLNPPLMSLYLMETEGTGGRRPRNVANAQRPTSMPES